MQFYILKHIESGLYVGANYNLASKDQALTLECASDPKQWKHVRPFETLSIDYMAEQAHPS